MENIPKLLWAKLLEKSLGHSGGCFQHSSGSGFWECSDALGTHCRCSSSLERSFWWNPKACTSYQYAAELDHFRICSTEQRPITLVGAIQWSHYALATDPWDKIYALLGLTLDGPQLVPILNYKQNLDQVLGDLTRAMVDADRSPDIFGSPSENKWPSWVTNSSYFWSELNTAPGSPMRSWNTIFSQIPMQQVPNEKALRAQETILGQVREISSFMNRGVFVPSSEFSKVDTYLDTSDLVSNLNMNYPSRIANAVLRSLSLGLAPAGTDCQYCSLK